MNNFPDQDKPGGQKKPLNVRKALLVGQLVVNLPAYLIYLGVLFAGVYHFGARLVSLSGWWFLLGLSALAVIVPALAGWLWWAFSVPRWRKWALQNGVPEDTLQKGAVAAGLVRPKGSILEKTEFRVKE